MVVVVIILHYLLAYRPDLDAPQSNYGKWHNVEKLWQRLVGNICYFPALALFLTARVILDHWSSMLFEVWDAIHNIYSYEEHCNEKLIDLDILARYQFRCRSDGITPKYQHYTSISFPPG